jgi:hypothetical protein
VRKLLPSILDLWEISSFHTKTKSALEKKFPSIVCNSAPIDCTLTRFESADEVISIEIEQIASLE